MRCDIPRVWLGVLLGASVSLGTSIGIAEKAKASISVSSEWQKGKRFAPTRRETHKLSPSTSITLSANTNLEVQSKVPLPTSIEGLGPFAHAAQLTSGRIDVNVDMKQKPATGLFIYGPRHTTVLVRGGRVAIVAGRSSLSVGVYEGKEASVGIGSAWKHVSAGNTLSVSTENPGGLEGKLPVAPRNIVVNRPVLAIEGGTDATLVTWDAVLGAKSYTLRLLNTETKSRKHLETDRPSAALRGLDPGRYELRVSAVDPSGLDGAASEPAPVNVVGIVLPPGAFAAQGKVYLETLQQLTLTHVDGLEATYDQAPVYFKAANRASLRGMQATTLHLRIPGSKERVSLELMPRDLHTQVEITPALARWPRDKVTIRVTIPKQLANAPSLQLVPAVTVNNRVVNVDWARLGDTMETVLAAPPIYPGPWVVRAEVTDQHGIVLGRNFLEIASTAGLDDEDIPREIHRGPVQAQAKASLSD